jgi:serine/threonine protein kinase
MSAKLTDFGTSRALSDEELTMTSVGTPLFCAPEVMKGENYDEKVDVYAFGMSLMIICMQEDILEFLRTRYCAHFNKPKRPKQPMR